MNAPRPTPPGGPGSAAGWYPDPWSPDRPIQRYWDGRDWTGHTHQAVSTTPGPATTGTGTTDPTGAGTTDTGTIAPEPPKPRRARSMLAPIKWGALGAFVVGVVVIGVALASGQQVKTVDVKNGKIELYAVEEVETERLEQAQPEIEERVEEIEQQARQDGSEVAQSAVADFAGTWSSGNGIDYEITQFGDAVVIQEVTQFGISAYGEGFIDGSQALFDFEAVDGSFGTAVLTLIDVDRIQAEFANVTWGSTRIALTRR